MTRRKIGLLGGTFNPVHLGHLQLAEAAIAECGLDQVLFIPAGWPPHKDETEIASFAHRVAMLRIACGQDTRFSCSAIEGELPTPSYTIDTLRAIAGKYSGGTGFFFIIGSDAFLEILSWKSYCEVLRCVTFIIAERQGHSFDRLHGFLRELDYVDNGISWKRKDGYKDIILLDTRPGDFSATALRREISKGMLPGKYVPDQVLLYIKNHNLYQSGKTITHYCPCLN